MGWMTRQSGFNFLGLGERGGKYFSLLHCLGVPYTAYFWAPGGLFPGVKRTGVEPNAYL